MHQASKDRSAADHDLVSLAATLEDISNTFRRIPHLRRVADTLSQAANQLKEVRQQSFGTIPDPTEADRRRRGYPN